LAYFIRDELHAIPEISSHHKQVPISPSPAKLTLCIVPRYGMIASVKANQLTPASRELASNLAESLKVGNYQVGKTKIFFKNPKAVSCTTFRADHFFE